MLFSLHTGTLIAVSPAIPLKNLRDIQLLIIPARLSFIDAGLLLFCECVRLTRLPMPASGSSMLSLSSPDRAVSRGARGDAIMKLPNLKCFCASRAHWGRPTMGARCARYSPLDLCSTETSTHFDGAPAIRFDVVWPTVVHRWSCSIRQMCDPLETYGCSGLVMASKVS